LSDVSDSFSAGFGLAVPAASSGEFFDAAQDGRGERKLESGASMSLTHKQAAVGQRKVGEASMIAAHPAGFRRARLSRICRVALERSRWLDDVNAAATSPFASSASQVAASSVALK
jgi:hypothetical protein